MQRCIMGVWATVVALSSVASADTWKLGSQKWELHGCATDRAAAVLADFVHRDPTFTMTRDRAVITESTPWKDGVKETSWSAKLVLERGLASWEFPRDDKTHQQIRILVDVTPFKWSYDLTPNIHVSIIVDYDPQNTGTHQNVCSEQWFGQAVRL